MLKSDELGPEIIYQVSDGATGMQGVIVVDNSILGPCGGGTRMAPDVTVDEVAELARGMTHKFAIHGFARGGSKGGIVGDPAMPAAQKREFMQAFGRRVAPLLRQYDVACGPDMGVGLDDVDELYRGAGVANRRSGLFQKMHEGDPLAFHLTGFGVACSLASACKASEIAIDEVRVAIEGFGQVGVGSARYAARRGAKVVAISTLAGAIYNESGLDIERMVELRREHGDACVQRYAAGEMISPTEIYFLPVDALVPGARPEVINRDNCGRIRAKIIVSGGNLSITPDADQQLFARGVVTVPDFVANGGGMIASLVDFHGGTAGQAFAAIERLISPLTEELLAEAQQSRQTAHQIATARVRETVRTRRGQARGGFEQSMAQIKDTLGVF